MHRHRRDIFQLGIYIRWNGHAQLLQHILQALNRKRRLGGFIPSSGQAHHEAITNQVIGAHACDIRDILNPHRLGG